MVCPVCCEKYNKTTRKSVSCAHCNYEACRNCQKTYMLSTIQEPHCMNCKIPWNVDKILSSFTKVFFQTELRAHREKMLFEREKALLPASQQEVRHENLTKELELLRELAHLYRKSTKEAHYLQEAKKIADELGVPEDGEVEAGPSAPAKDTRPRPLAGCIADNCRGFIMNNNWRCGLCDMKVCKKCLKEKTEDHVCKKEDVETRDLLLKNSKPCPKCGVMINKIDGCDQMWCVMCKTTFSWKTGEMSSGKVHNPHYYEWLRRTGQDVPRDPLDVPPPRQMGCGEDFPLAFELHTNLERKHYTREENQLVMGLYRLHMHIESVDIPAVDRNLRAMENNELRKSFLRGDIDEDQFKREIFIRERTRERSQALHDVMALYSAQLRTILLAFYNDKPDFESTTTELQSLTDYCNDCFVSIAKTYNVKPFCIMLKTFTMERK